MVLTYNCCSTKINLWYMIKLTFENTRLSYLITDFKLTKWNADYVQVLHTNTIAQGYRVIKNWYFRNMSFVMHIFTKMIKYIFISFQFIILASISVPNFLLWLFISFIFVSVCPNLFSWYTFYKVHAIKYHLKNL